MGNSHRHGPQITVMVKAETKAEKKKCRREQISRERRSCSAGARAIRSLLCPLSTLKRKARSSSACSYQISGVYTRFFKFPDFGASHVGPGGKLSLSETKDHANECEWQTVHLRYGAEEKSFSCLVSSNLIIPFCTRWRAGVYTGGPKRPLLGVLSGFPDLPDYLEAIVFYSMDTRRRIRHQFRSPGMWPFDAPCDVKVVENEWSATSVLTQALSFFLPNPPNLLWINNEALNIKSVPRNPYFSSSKSS